MSIATGQLTIVDMNDFESGTIPPIEPVENTVWLDTSVNPPVFKIWNGSEWINENDWQESLKQLEDSLTETKQTLEGTSAEINILKKEIDLKAETNYVDRIKQELVYGGKNLMPYTYSKRENVHSFWTTSHNSLANMSITMYDFSVPGNEDYFIADELIFKFSVDCNKATEQSLNYVTSNVIDEKKFIKLKPNTKYTFSLWINKNSFCNKFKFTIFSKSTGREFATSSLYSPTNDVFKRYALSFTTDSTEEYYVILYNYPNIGSAGNSNIYLYNMIIEKGDATDTWSPCLEDVNSSSVIYMEESLRQLRSNLKVSDDKIVASVTKIDSEVKTLDGTVKNNAQWIETTQMSIESGKFFVSSSNFLPGNSNLMPYTNLAIENIQKYWQINPKGTITKRLYDFGEISSEDNFLYNKNVLMFSCTPSDASTVSNSILTVNVVPDKRKIVLKTNKKYTISYYIYITDRIKSAKCRIWNVAKNSSLDINIENETTVTKYTAHFVKVEVSFNTTDVDTEYFPQLIIEMKKDLLRDANVYIANMMIQEGALNINWVSNEQDSRLIATDELNSEMSKINNKFLEYTENLSNLNNYLEGSFKDGIIDFSESETIKESLRYLDAEKKRIDRKYSEIINNPSLSKMINNASFDDFIPMDNDDVALYAGPTISDITVLEAFRNGRFKIRYRLTNEIKNDKTDHFISKNGSNYEAVTPIKFGEYYEVIGEGLPAGDNRVTIKVINSQGQSVSPNVTVTIKENTKNHLTFSKTQYDSKYNSLVSIINRIVDLGKVTEEDKAQYQTAYNNYGNSLADFHAAFDSALDEIAESKVSQLSQQMDKKMASFSVSAEKIESRVESTETTISNVVDNVTNIQGSLGKVDQAVKDAKDAADLARNAANEAIGSAENALSTLSDLSNDNKLTSVEKQSTKLELDKIIGEKDKIIADANRYDQSTVDYINKFNILNEYATPLLRDLSSTSDIVGTTFRSTFTNYYNARQDLLNAISYKAKQLADNAQNIANQNKNNIESINSEITKTNSKVSTIEQSVSGIDLKVSEVEKTTTFHTSTLNSHTNSLNAVDGKINTAKNEAISSAASDASNKANNAKNEAINSANNHTNNQIKVVNEKITSNTSSLNILKDKISLKVEQSDIDKTVIDKFNSIQIGVRNIVPNSNDLRKWNKETGIETTLESSGFSKVKKTISSQESKGVYMDISVESSKQYVLSFKSGICSNGFVGIGSFLPGNNNWRHYLGGYQSLSNNKKHTFLFTTNSGETKVRLYFNISSSGAIGSYIEIKEIKVECGNKATDWTTAPEDVQNQIDKNKNDISNTKTEINKTNNKVSEIQQSIGGINLKVSEVEKTTISHTSTLNSHTNSINAVDGKINTARNEAISSAASDATNKANNAKNQAISSAASDATNKANNAKNEAINSANNHTNNQISAVTQKITANKSEIDVLKNKISLKVEQTDIDKSLNDFNIGTRNYLKKSKVNITTSNYHIVNLNLGKEEPQEGEIFTISIKGKLGSGKHGFGIYNSGGNISLTTVTNKNSDGIYFETFVWRVGSTLNNFISIYALHNSVSATSTIEWVKLERGKKNTDWSAAPEDAEDYTNTKVTEVKSEIKITTDGISQEVSKKVNSNQIISTINQTAESVKIKADKIQLEGSVTVGEQGRRVKIEQANYSMFDGNIKKGILGFRNVTNDGFDTVPRLALGSDGMNSDQPYFVITPYSQNNNPGTNSKAYVDIAYRVPKFNDWSNIKMFNDGDVRVAAIKDFIVTTNYVNGSHGGQAEHKVAMFAGSTSSYYTGNLQIEAVRNMSNAYGLVLADDHASSKCAVRVNVDSNNNRFFRPLINNANVELGSSGFKWKKVHSANGVAYSVTDVDKTKNITYMDNSIDSVIDTLDFDMNIFRNNPTDSGDIQLNLNVAKLKNHPLSEMFLNVTEEVNDIDNTIQTNTTADMTSLLHLALYELQKCKKEIELLKEQIAATNK